VRIAVIADTHDRVPATLPKLLRGAEEIWHLGDVCAPSILDQLNDTGCALRVVRGNGDFDFNWPLTLNLERGGVTFHLVHIPPRQPPTGCSVLLHGHLHVPRDEVIDGVRWMSPGSVTWPRQGSRAGFAWLTVEDGEISSWERELL